MCPAQDVKSPGQVEGHCVHDLCELSNSFGHWIILKSLGRFVHQVDVSEISHQVKVIDTVL